MLVLWAWARTRQTRETSGIRCRAAPRPGQLVLTETVWSHEKQASFGSGGDSCRSFSQTSACAGVGRVSSSNGVDGFGVERCAEPRGKVETRRSIGERSARHQRRWLGLTRLFRMSD